MTIVESFSASNISSDNTSTSTRLISDRGLAQSHELLHRPFGQVSDPFAEPDSHFLNRYNALDCRSLNRSLPKMKTVTLSYEELRIA